MAIYIASLNSGSNGNCYYIGTGKEAILIDAGISCREIETRMKRLNLAVEKIKAIFISHEHNDHIRGLAVLSRKYALPVYITKPTRNHARLKLGKNLTHEFRHNQPVFIGELQITPFSKQHDAADPYSFTISYNNIHVGVYTDIGKPCTQLISHFQKCHAAFLESNYDEEMLENGKYPYYLKTRITSGKGHLSNKQALELFLQHKPAHMSHLFLSHLSKNNNDPELVQRLFDKHAGTVKMIVTSRYEESKVYAIGNQGSKIERIISFLPLPQQLKLDFE